MTYARKTLISLKDTPYYHIVARCVRRAWLWGYDEYADRDYCHRKVWVLERLSTLASLFAIDVCAYAVMSNHYHLVLHVDRSKAVTWTRGEIVSRWGKLFGVPALVERWFSGQADKAEREVAEVLIERWRERLHDVSWFMRCLNEHLARRANAEEHCTGRFWEGRFRSQALLDEAGLLAAMAYVDLNPIRAGVSATPEESEFTSIYARIRQARHMRPIESREAVPLRPFQHSAAAAQDTLPGTLDDYLQLIDWTGRCIRGNKSGSIERHAPPVALRLHFEPEAWMLAMRPHGNVFGRAMGRLDRMRLHARTLGQSWVRGLHQAVCTFV